MTRSATTLASVVSSPPPPPPHRTSPRSRALHSASLFFLLVASFLVAAPSLLLHPVSAEASLLSLQSSVSSPLSPSFTPSTADRAFTQYVPQPTQEMNFTVVAQGADQVRARWNGGQRFDLVSGVSTPKLALNLTAPFNELVITLSSSGSADVVYTLDILRLSVVGKNSLLLDLQFLPTDAQVSAGITTVVQSLSKDFSALSTYYTVQLLPDVAEFTYRPLFDSASSALAATYIFSRPAPPGVNIAVKNIPLSNQQAAPFVSMLGVTLLRLNITVTAEDRVTTRDYTFDIAKSTSGGAGGGAGGGGTTSSTADSGALQGGTSSTGAAGDTGNDGPLGAASTSASSWWTILLAIVAGFALLRLR